MDIFDTRTAWFIYGALALLTAKYIVFGLDNWNAVLHPGLVIANNQRWATEPFFGLLNKE